MSSNKIRGLTSFSNLISKDTKKIAVAVSGGCDSVALTFLLKEFCQESNIILYALTVDHKMRLGSGQEASDLGKILKKKQITHKILAIDSQDVPTSNKEANMRNLRYELLYNFCKSEKIDHLFLGHHIGDIAENYLIRLFRGSGLDGLSPIKEVVNYKEVKLIRPLLETTKEDLKNYLEENNISWFEDESNKDEKFLRNKIRNFLSTFEEKELINQRIKNTSDEISQIRDFFDEKMLSQAKGILLFQNKEEPKFLIDIKKIQEIDEKYALKILSLAFMEISRRDYKPRLKELKKFYSDIKHGVIRDFYGCSVVGENIIEVAQKKKTKDSFYLRTILKDLA